MVMNSFSFCLSGKLFISPSILHDNLAGQSVQGCSSLQHFKHTMHFKYILLSFKVSAKKSAYSFTGVSSYVTLFFSCCLQNSLFNIYHVNYAMSWFVWVALDWDSLCFLCLDMFPSVEVYSHNSFFLIQFLKFYLLKNFYLN